MDFTYLQYEREGRIATITLNRPERLNAIHPEMPGEIRAAAFLTSRQKTTFDHSANRTRSLLLLPKYPRDWDVSLSRGLAFALVPGRNQRF